MKSKSIPKKYMWNKGIRKCSPVENELQKLKLEEIACPNCGRLYLRLGEYGYCVPKYNVICDACDWETPIKPMYDSGDAIAEFKDWLTAYILLDEPKDRLNENLILEFWPNENGERDKARMEYEAEDAI